MLHCALLPTATGYVGTEGNWSTKVNPQHTEVDGTSSALVSLGEEGLFTWFSEGRVY